MDTDSYSYYIDILSQISHPYHQQVSDICINLLKASTIDPFSYLDYHILICITTPIIDEYLLRCRKYNCPKSLYELFIGIYLFYHPQEKNNKLFRLPPTIRVNKFCKYIVDHGRSSDLRCPLSIEQVFDQSIDISVHHYQALINYLNSKTMNDYLISSMKHFSKTIC
jgi:hypothetical protein